LSLTCLHRSFEAYREAVGVFVSELRKAIEESKKAKDPEAAEKAFQDGLNVR
jgi:hypothetical protein